MTTMFAQTRATLPHNTVYGSKKEQRTYKREQNISYRLMTRRRSPAGTQTLNQENIT